MKRNNGAVDLPCSSIYCFKVRQFWIDRIYFWLKRSFYNVSPQTILAVVKWSQNIDESLKICDQSRRWKKSNIKTVQKMETWNIL